MYSQIEFTEFIYLFILTIHTAVLKSIFYIFFFIFFERERKNHLQK